MIKITNVLNNIFITFVDLKNRGIRCMLYINMLYVICY